MEKISIKAKNREELEEKIKRLITLKENEKVKITVLKEPKKVLFFNTLGLYEIEIIKKSAEKEIARNSEKLNENNYNNRENYFRAKNNEQKRENKEKRNNSKQIERFSNKKKYENNKEKREFFDRNNVKNNARITQTQNRNDNIKNVQSVQNKQTQKIQEESVDLNFDKIRSFLKEFIVKSKLDIVIVNIEKVQERYIVNVDGKDIRYLIGEKGSTLNSVEYLLTAVKSLKNIRVVIDSNNYKEKREEALRELARKKGKKVLENGKPVKLNPMSARERKIIHEEISFIKGLKTESVGEEPKRYLIIKKLRDDVKI